MASFRAMGNRRDEIAKRRRETWIAVGLHSDKIVRDLKEIVRLEKATAVHELPHVPPLSRCNGAAGGGGFSSHGACPGLTEPTTSVCDASAHRSVGPAPIMPSAPDTRRQRPLVDSEKLEKTGGQRACANPPAVDPAQGGSGESRGSMGETGEAVGLNSSPVPTAGHAGATSSGTRGVKIVTKEPDPGPVS